MPLNPGALRHQVVIKTPVLVADGAGGYTPGSATTFATVWASIDPLKASERIQSMQAEAEISHEIKIRYVAGVRAKMYIEHEGRTFQIIAQPMDFEERHEMLVLLCLELEAVA